jgi:hypothetical protein
LKLNEGDYYYYLRTLLILGSIDNPELHFKSAIAFKQALLDVI